MIDPRELRIGNYVLDLDGSLHKIASGVDIDGSWNPIPLTEEWLIKFNIKKEDNLFRIPLNDEDGYIFISFQKEWRGCVSPVNGLPSI